MAIKTFLIAVLVIATVSQVLAETTATSGGKAAPDVGAQADGPQAPAVEKIAASLDEGKDATPADGKSISGVSEDMVERAVENEDDGIYDDEEGEIDPETLENADRQFDGADDPEENEDGDDFEPLQDEIVERLGEEKDAEVDGPIVNEASSTETASGTRNKDL